MLFRLKKGRHNEGEQKYYEGDLIETKHDLVRMFGDNKFEKVAEGSAPTSATSQTTIEKPSGKKKTVVSKSTAKSKDVTAQYPVAKDNNLKVLYTAGKGFDVFDLDSEDSNVPSNEEPLRKTEVEAFIDSLFDEE